MNMKKTVSLLLALALVCALAACHQKNPEVTPTEPPAASQPTAPQETAAPQATVPGGDPTQPSTNGETVPPTDPGPADETPTQPTIPDVNVELGVVPGEPVPDADEDSGSNTPPATQPTDPPDPTDAPADPDAPVDLSTLTYESYNALSGPQQQKVIEAFASVDEFVKWYRAVEAQYKAEHPEIEIGPDGNVDLGDLGG